MADLSRRALLRSIPGAAAVTVVPAVAVAAIVTPADAKILALAARVVVLAKESDDAHTDLSNREDAASDDYPDRPSMLEAKFPYKRENESVESLQVWFDGLKPDDMPYRGIAGRLARMRAWQAECAAIDERHGVPAALDRCDRVNALVLDDLVPRLTDMQPATIAGIRAKADAFVALDNWGIAHNVIENLMQSIVADMRRLAGGAGV